VDSLKERMVRPFAARDVRTLHALDGISFDIRQGEFFGIVGRNGSGKSTLLKLLASIYRADAGTIRLAGRLAPFIELGVGFNPELTARENVVLNGVMMGLTPKETRDKLDSVIEFAELEEFVDLKLKNYSSGMQVRLAFSVMLEADADVLLIDEVLAVGDAAFQQKCADSFHQMKAQGKTIVLVTHEMSSVEEYCHRAMLIDDGKILHIGDPREVGRHYLQLNFERGSPEDHATVEAQPGDEVNLVDLWLEDEAGERIENVEHGVHFHLCAELETLRPMEGLGVSFAIANADGIPIADFGVTPHRDGEVQPFEAGQRITVRADIENLLMAGRYFVHIGVTRGLSQGVALYINSAADFAVFGGSPTASVISLPHKIEADVTEAETEGSPR
jgi:ABC-type polysaccharide/polyol phosphate transport system ATPase subunit